MLVGCCGCIESLSSDVSGIVQTPAERGLPPNIVPVFQRYKDDVREINRHGVLKILSAAV